MKNKRVCLHVLQSVITSEVSKGHLKWKVSDIARLAKVSRPLVYYHFGKTKKEILSTCLEVIAKEYYGLNPEREEMIKKGELAESLLKTREIFLANPSLVVFYQKSRMQNNSVNAQLKQIEKRYQEKLARAFPQLTTEQVVAVHALFHGVITAPFLDEKSFKESVRFLQKMIF